MDVTMPDGTVIQGVPDGTTQAQLSAKYAAHLGGTGAQPSLMDKVIASPAGRFVQDNVIAPVEGLTHSTPFDINSADPSTSALASPVHYFLNKASQAEQAGYQAALARNRNTPGYAAARASANANMPKSGLGDQVLPGVLPALAGLPGALTGDMDTSNAMADAQTDNQNTYRAQNPIKSTIAGIGGGLLLAPERGALPQIAATQAVPSVADLKTAADAAYKQVDNSGLVVSQPSYDNMVAGAQAKMDKLGLDPALHPDATAAMGRLQQLQTSPGAAPAAGIPFQKVNTLREIAGDAAGAQMPRDAMRAGVLQDHIDDFVDSLKPSDLVSANGAPVDPTATVSALNDARDLWSRAKQSQTIQSAIDKAGIKAGAYSQSGSENALRAQFRQLALNDRQMSRLSPDVQTAVKQVASGGPVSNIMRYVGKLAPRGVVSAAVSTGLGGAIGGVPGAMALPMLGEVARAGATQLTARAAQRASDIAALGRTAPVLPAPALQLPRLTPQSRLPFGIVTQLPQRQSQ